MTPSWLARLNDFLPWLNPILGLVAGVLAAMVIAAAAGRLPVQPWRPAASAVRVVQQPAPDRVPENGPAAGMAGIVALRLIRTQADSPPASSAWQLSLAWRANSEAFRTKDPKQIDRAVGASFTLAFHLAVANQAIQSRPGPAIIGSLDQP